MTSPAHETHASGLLPRLGLITAVMIVPILEQPREAGMGLALILTGAPFYLFWHAKQRAA
jgi:hypothetical protein